MMSSVKLILTDAQLRKMKSSSPFQLSHKQLSGKSTGKHEITKTGHQENSSGEIARLTPPAQV